MRYFFLFVLAFLLSFESISQKSLDDINTTRCRHTLNGMIAFTTWTGANFVAGAVGVATTRGELQHFFEMNIYFNVINLGIAIPGLIGAIKAKPQGLNFEQSIKESQKVKTLFLVNGVLDLTYITAGFLLREIGKNQQDIGAQNRFLGYGDSFIVQGGFLLLFDFIKFGLHTANGKHLDAHWKNFSFQPYGAYGLGLSVVYNFNHP